MSDEDEACCPQCRFPFVNGEMIAEVHYDCPNHGHEVMMIHIGMCVMDFMADVDTNLTRNKMIGLRRLN